MMEPHCNDATNESELRDFVRRSAEQFVADLHEAERATSGWSDERESNRRVDAALRGLLDRLDSLNHRGESNRLLSSELWRVAGPWLQRGPLQLRAHDKPRGYAGDFEMLTMIARGEVSPDPLGRAFDIFFQRQAAPCAVRERIQTVAKTIVEECRSRLEDADFPRSRLPLRIVSVGCGPAIDVESALSILTPAERRGVRVSLLDLDGEALEAAAKRVAPSLLDESPSEPPSDSRLEWKRENLFRLPRIRDRAGVADESADFVFCTGLFDYLEDKDAVAMIETLAASLRPGGRLLAFNFLEGNPSRSYMEWIGNWYLLYRRPEDLKRLAEAAGIACRSVVRTDASEVVGWIDMRRPG